MRLNRATLKRHGLAVWNFKLPVLGCLFYWAVCYYRKSGVLIPSRFHELLDSAINVSGVAVSFIVTLQGILLALTGNPVVAGFKKAGRFPELIAHFSSAIRWSTAVLIFGILGQFFDARTTHKWMDYVFLLFIFSSICAGQAILRITRMFTDIAKRGVD